MNLEELILSDYGTIPMKIGMYLLKYNTNTFENIQKSTGMSTIEVRNGLSILIQRKFVKFFIVENITRYQLDKDSLRRRLYFPIYSKYIYDKYNNIEHKYFLNVLINGIVKETADNKEIDQLLNDEILQLENSKMNKKLQERLWMDDLLDNKFKKSSIRYLSVNFNNLDQKIFNFEIYKYISKKYNESAGEVFKSILKCDKIDKNTIIKNLEFTKILCLENNTLINDKDNINEYLKYLCNSGVICKNFDETTPYFVSSDKTKLKIFKINQILNDTELRRLFNMIYYKKDLEDKDITIYSLFSINKIKLRLLQLQNMGLITQKCCEEYKNNMRIEHSWYVDLNFTSNSMIKRIERVIIDKLKNYNECWDVNYYLDNSDGNTEVWVSDMINLSIDHLIFNLE